MSASETHYELHVRRRAGGEWTLDHAAPDRAAVLAAAAAMLADGRCIAVRVFKEVYDPADGRFAAVRVMEKGAVEDPRRLPVRRAEAALACTGPGDLHTAHARARIGRVMEAYLRRRQVTPWELLHRPDLAEELEASGMEVQGAVQRVALAEAQARGTSSHDMVRAFRKLADAALERLIRDGRRRRFPTVDAANFAVTAGRLCEDAEGGRLLNLAVAEHLAGAEEGPSHWGAKTQRLLDLLEAAPEVGRPRALALRAVEPPLGEILGGAAPLAEVLGSELDLGAQLAVLLRIAARRELEALAAVSPETVRAIPALHGAAERMARLLDGAALETVRGAVGARVLRELMGPRRLRPADPDGEIDILRALAAVLAAAGDGLLARDDVQAAFVERSKRLITPDFVAAHLAGRNGTLDEARALVRLCENLTGPINRRGGARWLLATLESRRFETEVRQGADPPGARLAALAALQRAAEACGLPGVEAAAVRTRLGEAGGWVEADTRLTASLGRSDADVLVRLNALMRLASGEAAPLGPAADRARAAAAALIRAPGVQAQLASRPESLRAPKPPAAA